MFGGIGGLHGRSIVAAEVVHDDDVARSELRHQQPIDIDLEGAAA